ncbi:MAG: hypothetical protein PHW56_10005 [Methanosarcinaceae archaeon]|nr:hypothetical protein [Methanosarcinaceae archaeon]
MNDYRELDLIYKSKGPGRSEETGISKPGHDVENPASSKNRKNTFDRFWQKNLLSRLARICEPDLLFCRNRVDFWGSDNPGPQRLKSDFFYYDAKRIKTTFTPNAG